MIVVVSLAGCQCFGAKKGVSEEKEVADELASRRIPGW